MTRTLRKKLFRDLKANFVQFLSIFIMCFFAMFILQGFDATVEGYAVALDEYCLETDFSDLVATSDGFNTDDLAMIKSLPSVKTAELRASSVGKVRLSQEKKVEFNFINENNISRMHLYEGEPFEPGMNGIWLDRDFATAEKIGVGDILSLTCDNVEFSEPVIGIMDNPDHIYYIVDNTFDDVERGAYGYAFLDSGEYPGKKLVFDSVHIKLKDVKNQYHLTDEEKSLINRTAEELKKLLQKNNLSVTTKMKDAGYDAIVQDIKSNMTLERVFPVLFITIAALGIITTMTRIVMKQRTIIGTLKALGFSEGTVMLHYISYSVVVSLVGGILGAIAGWFTLGDLLSYFFTFYYIFPEVGMRVSMRVVLVLLFLVLLSGVTNYLSCRSLLTKRASEILRPAPPVVTGAGFLEKTFIWKHLDFVTKWNIRDINRNRLRTAAGILGITLTSSLTLTSFGANELLKGMEKWQFHQLSPSAYQIGFVPNTNLDTVYEYSKKYRGQMIQEKQATLSSRNGETIQLTATVVDEGNLFRFQDATGAFVKLPRHGIAVSRRAAESLKVGIGDEVSFANTDRKGRGSGKVELIYISPNPQGIAMSRSVYERMENEFTPSRVLTNMTVPASLATDKEEVVSVVSAERSIQAMRRKSSGTSGEVLYTMVIAIIVGIVVMYNLGVLSFVEKTREIATLKVLGFKTSGIRWILQQQNIFVTGLGTAIGLSLGLKMLMMLMSSLSVDDDYVYRISPMSYLLAFFLSFVLSLIVNSVLSSKVKDINMVEALKGVE